MLPEIRHVAISVFTHKKHYCTPNCPYFCPSMDGTADGIIPAECKLFGKFVKWDKRVKHNFGFRRLEECKYAETMANGI
jgi:hypothetical protein